MSEALFSCILVGVHLDNSREAGTAAAAERFERSMRELAALAEAAGMRVLGSFGQHVREISAATYIGSGKAEEIRNYLKMMETEDPVDAVLVNDTISPAQLENLSDLLELPILDRTGLILRIFADRARTREARLQVESAQLQYMLPRLQGMHRELGRQGGGSGPISNKGAGETKIELDRRHIEQRMARLRKELEAVARERETQRSRRLDSGIPRVSLVGYTNAGKSTIMNAVLNLCGAGDERRVLEKDMLFATLDTTVRRIEPGGRNRPFLLSDTVGFVSNLPTTLVRAFRSTLEEACHADLMLIVTDLSDPDYAAQAAVTQQTLREIGAGAVPRIFVFNKADAAGIRTAPHLDGIEPEDGLVTISARNPEDVRRLVDLIVTRLEEGREECELCIPYADGALLAQLRKETAFTVLGYEAEGTRVLARLGQQERRKYLPYMVE